jgi:hypothetical protein
MEEVVAINTNDLNPQKHRGPDRLLLPIIPYLMTVKSLPRRPADGTARALLFDELPTQLVPPRFAEAFARPQIPVPEWLRDQLDAQLERGEQPTLWLAFSCGVRVSDCEAYLAVDPHLRCDRKRSKCALHYRACATMSITPAHDLPSPLRVPFFCVHA